MRLAVGPSVKRLFISSPGHAVGMGVRGKASSGPSHDEYAVGARVLSL